jgi:isocitrate dehydrogenase (NAD+)
MQTTTEKRRVTLIKGDGIGPEIADAVTEILDAASAPVVWEEAEAGLACVEKYGNGLPPETLESVRRNRVALKGPTTTPAGSGHKSVNVTIRKTLDLFANVRPARTLPGVETRFSNVNLILVRENIEDTYGGIEHWQTPDVTQCLKVVTRPGSLAVIRYAFEMARSMKRRRVTCVHKANIHKITDGLFLDCFRDVAEDYTDLQADDVLIDNACMQLVTRPEQYDVMVLPNLYGDIVSASRPAATSASTAPSSSRSTAPRRTSRGRVSPTRPRSCSRPHSCSTTRGTRAARTAWSAPSKRRSPPA